jgi:hypothetical protein
VSHAGPPNGAFDGDRERAQDGRGGVLLLNYDPGGGWRYARRRVKQEGYEGWGLRGTFETIVDFECAG